VKSVTENGALLSDLAGEVVRLPLAVLVPDRVGPSTRPAGEGCEHEAANDQQRVGRFGRPLGRGFRLWHAKRPFT